MNTRISVHVAALAALLAGSSAFAQTRAVEKTHVEFGFNSTDSDTSDSTSSGTLGVDLIATFPLGGYFGASIGGAYSESNVRTRDVLGDNPDAVPGSRQSCSFDSTGGEVGLFFRRPTFGRIGVTYGKGDLSADCEGESVFLLTGKDSLSTENLGVNAEYYLGDFTLGAAYTTTQLEDSSEDLKTTTLSASWYPIDSLKLSLWGNDLYDDNTYGFVVEHQPQMLGDGFSVKLGVSTTDEDPKTRTITLGLAYFFGREVPLKARDRQYR
jgi:hypothetical protein